MYIDPRQGIPNLSEPAFLQPDGRFSGFGAALGGHALIRIFRVRFTAHRAPLQERRKALVQPPTALQVRNGKQAPSTNLWSDPRITLLIVEPALH